MQSLITAMQTNPALWPHVLLFAIVSGAVIITLAAAVYTALWRGHMRRRYRRRYSR